MTGRINKHEATDRLTKVLTLSKLTVGGVLAADSVDSVAEELMRILPTAKEIVVIIRYDDDDIGMSTSVSLPETLYLVEQCKMVDILLMDNEEVRRDDD